MTNYYIRKKATHNFFKLLYHEVIEGLDHYFRILEGGQI
jgi:hypothetical protein